MLTYIFIIYLHEIENKQVRTLVLLCVTKKKLLIKVAYLSKFCYHTSSCDPQPKVASFSSRAYQRPRCVSSCSPQASTARTLEERIWILLGHRGNIYVSSVFVLSAVGETLQQVLPSSKQFYQMSAHKITNSKPGKSWAELAFSTTAPESPPPHEFTRPLCC